MDLSIRTTRGTLLLSDIDPYTTIPNLKHLLNSDSRGAVLNIPEPHRQRLIYKSQVLSEGTLLEAGLTSGATLIVLTPSCGIPPLPKDDTQVPTRASINEALLNEAKRRGITAHIREEAPSRRNEGRQLGLPPELLEMLESNQSMLDVFEALQGRLAVMRRGGAAGAAAQEAPPEDGPIVAPEPTPAHITQLVEMGFPEAVVRKALILTRDNVAAAVEWVFQHGEDVDAAEPPTQEQLRAVYGGARGRGRGFVVRSLEDMVEHLQQMGFSQAAATTALLQHGSVDLALSQLLRQGSAGGAGRGRERQEDPQGPAPEGEAGAGAEGGRGASGSNASAGASLPVPASEGLQDRGEQAGGGAEVPSGEEVTTHDDEDDHFAEADEGEEEGDEREGGSGGEMDEEYGVEFLDPLATMGSMGGLELSELGSSDMEQILDGMPGDVYGAPGQGFLAFNALEGGGAPNDIFLRLMENPFLQQVLGGAGGPGGEGFAEGGERADGGQQPEGQS